MSRTFKHKRRRHFSEYWKRDKEYIDGTAFCWGYFLQLPTTKPKLRKEVYTEDPWMSTPSWWTRLRMRKPERRLAHMLEKKSLRVEDIEDMDFPDLGKKPHIYFW